jgi:hypothetical protein
VPLDLLALLMLIDGAVDGGNEHAAIEAARLADRVLDTAPASFLSVADAPNVFKLVTKGEADSSVPEHGGDYLRAVLDGDDDHIEITTERRIAFDTLVGCVDKAALIGAAVMYGLLRGHTMTPRDLDADA